MRHLREATKHLFQRVLDILRGTELHALRESILRCQNRLDAPMTVAVIGERCSSKSTLVNALLAQEEVVRTGPLEETYNVSWLTFGPPDGPAVVHFKSAAQGATEVPRPQWASWANRMGQVTLQDAVQHIEVTHDNPILKTFSLIDTPGLSSYYGTDSRNTVEFLTQVRPDAVVLVFTKSVAQRSVELLRLFQGPLIRGANPINAVGVLGKIDGYWPDQPIPLEAGQRVAQRLMEQEPTVSSALFQLHPLCARLALGAQTLTDEDYQRLRYLANLPEERAARLLLTQARFAQDYPDLEISGAERNALSQKLTRYGVAEAISALRTSPDIAPANLSDLLMARSGFKAFAQDVIDHFGNRAYLIKLSNLLQILRHEIDHLAERVQGQEAAIAHDISVLLASFIRQQHAFRELDALKRYYNGTLHLSSEDGQELLRITGEFGASCRELLGLPPECTDHEMRDTCRYRQEHWHSRSVINIDTEEKDVSKLMERSYRRLARRIEQLIQSRDAMNDELYGNMGRRQESCTLWSYERHKSA